MTERYVRPDVRAIERAVTGPAWDERMLAYARAVEVMRARGPEDPTSWIAQATLHRERPRGTWLFLPWLRMYVWFLERIMRAIVVETGGPDGWALPVWRYADGDATLPADFRAPALPDGAANPLHRPDAQRAPGMNAGAPLPAAVTSPARALAARTFSPGFGGVPAGPGAGGEPAPGARGGLVPAGFGGVAGGAGGGGGAGPAGPARAPAARQRDRRPRLRRRARRGVPAAPGTGRPPVGGVATSRRRAREPGPV